MKIARFWSRDSATIAGVRVIARGWSNESIEAARGRARDVARRVGERVATSDIRSSYEYGDRPFPEPILREFPGAAVTRNHNGVLVLNTEQMMIVDIDLPDAEGAGPDSVHSSLFSLSPKGMQDTIELAHPALAGVRRVSERHCFSARIYQTARGYHVIVTNQPFRAGSSEAEAVLNEFGADRWYVRLSRVQESFRARLTPKPYRCGCDEPRVEYPFETPADNVKFRAWEVLYNRLAAKYSTCRFICAVGAGRVASEFAELITFHDQETKATSGLPLA